MAKTITMIDVNHESTDDEYESVPCTDAGRQFANRPYYKRVSKRASSWLGASGHQTTCLGLCE